MKICIINSIYPPYHRGGAEQVVVQTAEGLIDAGHQVVVITSTPESEGTSYENRARVHRLISPNIFFYTDAHKHGFFSRLLWHAIDIFNISAANKIRNILQKETPDIVHTHNLMGMSFLISRVIKRLGIRHIHTVHDVQLVEPSGIIFKEKEHTWRYTGVPTRIYTWLMRALMGSPDVVISPSQFLKNFYSSRGFFRNSHIAILRNPMTFSPKARQPRENKKPLRILYIGQLEKHKGVDILMNAFESLTRREHCTVELHIVGGGSALSDIQRRATGFNHIHIHGRVERALLPALFETMDVTVVPSLCYENSPTVIFESLAFGLPIIASNIEGVAELIKEGENGMTFPTGDDRALANVLSWCADHPATVAAMQQKTNQSLIGLSRDEYIGTLIQFYKGNLS